MVPIGAQLLVYALRMAHFRLDSVRSDRIYELERLDAIAWRQIHIILIYYVIIMQLLIAFDCICIGFGVLRLLLFDAFLLSKLCEQVHFRVVLRLGLAILDLNAVDVQNRLLAAGFTRARFAPIEMRR